MVRVQVKHGEQPRDFHDATDAIPQHGVLRIGNGDDTIATLDLAEVASATRIGEDGAADIVLFVATDTTS
jgi:hypothetical protein